MSALFSKAELRAGVKAVHDEAAGVLEIACVMPADAPALFNEALADSALAVVVLQAILQSGPRFQKAAAAGTPMLCALCTDPLIGGGFAFVVALPANDNPANAISLGICPKCGPDRPAVERGAEEALRKIWPGLRCAVVTHPEGGRA